MAANMTIEEIEKDLSRVHTLLQNPANAAQYGPIKQRIMAALTQAYQNQNAQETATTGNPALVGIGSGINRVLQDVGSLPFLLGGSDSFDRRRAEIHDERAIMDPLKARAPSASIGETIGEIAATLPIGGVSGIGPKSMLGMGSTAAGRIGGNAAIGAAQGALGSDDPLAGAVFGGVGMGLMSGAGEGYRALARARAPAAYPGIDLLPADVFPGAAAAEGAARASLFGGGQIAKARNLQDDQVKGVLQGLADRAPAGDPVLESLQTQMKVRKAEAGHLYDVVEQATAGVPVSPFAQNWRTEATQIVLDELKKPEGRRDQNLVNTLRAYLEEPDVNVPWGDLRRLRSDLKGDIRDAYKGTSQIGSKGVGALERTKTALETDLQAAIPPAARGQWKQADNFYRDYVAGPYGARGASAVRTAMAKETDEQASSYLLSPNVAGNTELVGKVHSALTPGGTRQIGHELTQGLLEAGTPTINEVAPRAAADYIGKRQAAFDQFVPGARSEALKNTLGTITSGTMSTLPTAGLRLAAAAVPLAVGTTAATVSAPLETDPAGDASRIATGLTWGGGALGAEALMAGTASAIATGRPGPLLNAMLRAYIPTAGRLAEDEDQ